MLSGAEKKPIRLQIEANGWHMMCANEVAKNIVSILAENGQFIIASDCKSIQVKKEDSTVEKTSLYRRLDDKYIDSSIEQILKEISGLNEIPTHRGFMSLGIDSLMIEQLRERICKQFGIEVLPAEMYEHSSMEKLIELLTKRSATKVSTKSSISIESSSTTTPDSTVPTTNMQENTSQMQIAIIGFSADLPNSHNVNEFFEHLINETELFVEAEKKENFVSVSSCLKDVYSFDANFFDVSKEDAEFLDPQIKVMLKVAHRALEEAGYCRKRRSQLKIGCFTTAEPSEFPSKKSFTQGSLMGMYSKNQKDFIAAWISHLLEINGPTSSVYSACSSR